MVWNSPFAGAGRRFITGLVAAFVAGCGANGTAPFEKPPADTTGVPGPGTTTLVVRAWNGLAWAAFFNARTETPNGDVFAAALDIALWSALQVVTAWPSEDLFAVFP